MTKRNWLIAAGIAAVVAIGAAVMLLSTPSETGTRTDAAITALEEVGPLPDMILGEEDAPVTIIEYASMTCPHCGLFHRQVFPQIKEDYIDTGKVRLIFREFPFDAIATAGSMLARCAEPEKYFGFIDVIFAQQEDWLRRDAPMEGIRDIARQGGFSDTEFQACLTDEAVLDGIRWIQTRGSEEFGVNSTPTFFINGQKVVGAIAYEPFRTLIEQHLGDEQPS